MFFGVSSHEVGMTLSQLAFHCYVYVVISFRLSYVASSVSNTEAVFNRMQVKNDDNGETALKLQVKERTLACRNNRQEKMSHGILCTSIKRLCRKIICITNLIISITVILSVTYL